MTQAQPAIHARFDDGILLHADVTAQSTIELVRKLVGDRKFPIIHADPWYGNVLKRKADRRDDEFAFIQEMLDWVNAWSDLLVDGGAFYVWGGIGVPGFRPFYGFMYQVERETSLTIANHITWKKKRGYGIQWNYLFTREEVAYLVKGDPKESHCFNVPYTDKLRGYEGYDPEHPAKSEFLRRSNVWDETEILQGKRHECQKPDRVNRISIETHTNPGDMVLDLFSGSGSYSMSARGLGRTWIAVEKDKNTCDKIVEWMKEKKS